MAQPIKKSLVSFYLLLNCFLIILFPTHTNAFRFLQQAAPAYQPTQPSSPLLLDLNATRNGGYKLLTTAAAAAATTAVGPASASTTEPTTVSILATTITDSPQSQPQPQPPPPSPALLPSQPSVVEHVGIETIAPLAPKTHSTTTTTASNTASATTTVATTTITTTTSNSTANVPSPSTANSNPRTGYTSTPQFASNREWAPPMSTEWVEPVDDEMVIDRLLQSTTTAQPASQNQATTNSSQSAGHAVQPPPPPAEDEAAQARAPHSDIHPLLIYSIRYEIRSYDLFHLSARSHQQQAAQMQSTNSLDSLDAHTQHGGGKHAKTLIAGLKNTIGLDFYYSESESSIFWIDVIEERIYRGTISNGTISNVEVIVQHGLATAEGLAVDWIGRNIYWIESTLDHIEVASMNGSYRRTLIAGDMENPRAIAVDPRYGWMFWSDWDKRSPRIERATMSGENRKVLVDIKELDGSWPNGITLDYDTKRVYWIDANSDSIHSVDYDGNDHQQLLSNIKLLGHPFSITLFESNIFWTDWKTNSVSMANKHNGSDSRELQHLTSRLFDIKVFHPNRQPRINESLNPCARDNGGCTHLCLLSTNHTRECECPHLMKLSRDGTSCEAYERVLLIGKSTEIRAVDINEPLHNVMAPIAAPKVFSPRQIEFDAKSKTIFWVDSQTNEVKRAQLASNGIDTIIDVIIESPSGLALDWISGNIYVTSQPQHRSSGKIYISNLNGEFISILMDGSSGLVSPKSIAVHPGLGQLFCIDETKDSQPIIFAARMDGSDMRVIVSKENNPRLDNPTSLAIDYELKRVYWINQVTNNSRLNNSLQYYDIELDKIITVIDGADSKTINPSVLCVDGSNLIISGRNLEGESIVKVPKDNVTDMSVLLQNQHLQLEQVFALRVYNASSQTGTNACQNENGFCSQLCVPTGVGLKRCKCTIGYNLNPLNEHECIGKSQFLIYSSNFGMKGISMDLNSSPDDYLLPPIHRAFRASSIDYVHRDNLIYWVDNEEGSITRINRDTTNYQVIVQGLESEESIGVDWVSGNIYWLDPYYDIIEVARLNGSNRYVIVSGDMDKANGIVVNPIKGYIVWSDIGAFPKIERANLDGTERRVIVSSNLVHIDDIAIDYREDYIYWVDSTSALIERIREDGTLRRVVYRATNTKNQQNHLVSIALYKEHLYVADSLNQGSIMRFDKNNASDQVVVQSNLGDGIRDIAVFAEQPMPSPEENPCARNNGGCQDLCLFMGKRAKMRCICSHGRLKSDGLTCEPYDTFVLFSKLTQIDSLHIKDEESANNAPYQPIVMESRSSIISLTVDYPAKRVIYSEIAHDQICSVLFNGTDRRVLVEKQSLVEGIAFAKDQLYWTSIQDNSISRLNTSSVGVLGKYCDNSGYCRNATVEKIVRLGSEDKPRGIAVDKCTSNIYWTNWNARNPSIQRARLEKGYKVETIIDTQIKVPNGITIDHEQMRLFWCDARLDKIETCDMEGTNRIILIHALPQHPFALATWDNYVFWTDWLARGVYRADKHSGQQLSQIKKVIQRPMGIAVAAEDNLVCPINQCSLNNGGCDENHTCIAHAGVERVECRPNELFLHQDKPFQTRFHTNSPTCEHGLPCGQLSPSQIYHGLLRDTLDRFNMTADSIDHSSSSLSTSVKQNAYPATTREVQYSTDSNTMTGGQQQQQQKTAKTQFLEESSDLHRSNQVSQQHTNEVPASQQATTHSPSTTSLPASAARTSKTPPSPTREPIMTVTTTTTTTITTSTTTAPDERASKLLPLIPANASNQLPPPAQATSFPSSASTTPAPCHIAPAALQTTTDSSSGADCKPQSEFKCYLSEKLVCIAADKRCDGISDCPSKEDENDCRFAKGGPYTPQRESIWHRYVTVIMIILAATVTALFLVFGTKGRRRWFVVGTNGAFNHRRMFDDNGTNIEISNPMFDEDDGNLVHCAFSIDLNERTTNFSNPLYERQFLLMNDKHVTSN